MENRQERHPLTSPNGSQSAQKQCADKYLGAAPRQRGISLYLAVIFFYSDQSLADRRNYIVALWSRVHWGGSGTATRLHTIGQDYICNVQPIGNFAT